MSSSISPSSESITLETVKDQLAQWRTTRVKGGRIPNTLWAAILSVTKKYDHKKVAAELNLNPHRLHTQMERQAQHILSSSSSPDFVELPLSSLPLPCPQKPSLKRTSEQTLEQKIFFPHEEGSLELTRPDGSILKASGLNHSDLCSLVKGFLG
jgi:hypothetical protein